MADVIIDDHLVPAEEITVFPIHRFDNATSTEDKELIHLQIQVRAEQSTYSYSFTKVIRSNLYWGSIVGVVWAISSSAGAALRGVIF